MFGGVIGATSAERPWPRCGKTLRRAQPLSRSWGHHATLGAPRYNTILPGGSRICSDVSDMDIQKPHTRSMHETDPTQSSLRGKANASQDEYQASGPEFTAPANLTPSSSRPPPAHPILKKPRGPSNSGPRPTARFVDVPDSEEETSAQNSSSQQNGSVKQPDTSTKNRENRAAAAAVAASRSRSPAKPEKKLPTGKKFVASTTTSKRRPVLPRRQSSQSSTGSAGSDVASRDGSISNTRQGTSQGSSNSSSRDSSPSRRPGSSGMPSAIEGQGSKHKAPEKRPTIEGTAEKRPTRPSPQFNNARFSNATASRMTSSPLAQEQTFADDPIRRQNRRESTMSNASTTSNATTSITEEPVVAGVTDSPETQTKSPGYGKLQAPPSKSARSVDTSIPIRTENGEAQAASGTMQSTRPGTSVSAQSQAKSNGAPPMTRSMSNNESRRASSGAVPKTNFKSPSVVGMSSIAVAGGFDFETPRARLLEDELPVLGADQPDIRKPSVLDSRLAPTQPSSVPAPPMARSKSQLTLLLERDKARIGDKHRIASTSFQKGDGKSDGKRQH